MPLLKRSRKKIAPPRRLPAPRPITSTNKAALGKHNESLVAEAQDDLTPTLNMKRLAFFKPFVMARRYRRHRKAFNDARPEGLVYLEMAFMPALIGLIIWLSISIPLNIMAVDALLPGDGRDFIITLIWLMGFSIFGTFCWGLVSGKMWMATYGELYLFKLPSVESKWKSDKGMKVYVPHVAMLPYQGDCLYGSMTKKSSYYRMYTFDALDKFTSLKTVMSQQPAIKQALLGPLEATYKSIRRHEDNAIKLQSRVKKGLGQIITDNIGLILCGICLLVTFFIILQMGEGNLLMRPDVTEHNERIKAEEQRRILELNIQNAEKNPIQNGETP